jgi:hypothetical protein
MDNPELLDSLSRSAVSAIDTVDVTDLERLGSPGAWLREMERQ